MEHGLFVLLQLFNSLDFSLMLLPTKVSDALTVTVYVSVGAVFAGRLHAADSPPFRLLRGTFFTSATV